ncbi:MAG: DUF1508 domain-containing protein [Myxococcaceae bacterium]
MNTLRASLLMLSLTLVACGPADAVIDGEDTGTMDAEAELAATTGKFETFQGKDGRYYFHLLAGNGEKVLASQGYSSAHSALDGVSSVKTNGANPMRYLQREASDGSRYFVLAAGNGEIIGVSQMYSSASNSERGAAAVQKVVANIVSTGAASAVDTHFETFKGLDGKYYFHLKANNGEIVLQSQSYTTKASATNGIASVKLNGQNTTRFEVRDAADGSSYFVLKAANGAVIGRSEMYASRSNAQDGTAVVQRLVTEAK